MTVNGILQIAIYLIVLVLLVKPLGGYMARVYQGERTLPGRVLGPVERLTYRLLGVNPEQEMGWKTYALAVLVFSVFGLLFLYALQRLQGFLPLNPQGQGAVSPDSSLNTAVSFATNTNWQGYGGETTMSYLTQMLALTVQNFVSAATGMAVLVALIRGFGSPFGQHGRQLLGRPDPQRALHPAAAVARAGAGPGLAGRGPELSAHTTTCRPGPADRGRQPASPGHRTDSGRRPGGLADRDQAARHQRRRLLQRQLGAPVREPDAAVQLPGDAGDPADPGCALLHLRQDGRRHAPGLGGARGDDRSSSSSSASGLCRGRAAGQPALRQRWASIRRQAICSRRQHGGQGDCASASPTRRSGPRRRRPPPTARSTRCTTRTRRSAAWCRCG